MKLDRLKSAVTAKTTPHACGTWCRHERAVQECREALDMLIENGWRITRPRLYQAIFDEVGVSTPNRRSFGIHLTHCESERWSQVKVSGPRG